MNPFYSIVCPVYNSSAYLEQNLLNLLSNVFRDFEIIIVDDGSSDNTFSICSELSKKDKRLKVFKKGNEGPLIARAFGANHCIGNYILFLDSDDRFTDNGLNDLHDFIIESNFPDFVVFDVKCKKTNQNFFIKTLNSANSQCFEDCLFLKKCLLENKINGLYFKCFKNINFIFNLDELREKNALIEEDLIMSAILFDQYHNSAYYKKAIYEYTYRPGSLMNKSFVADMDLYVNKYTIDFLLNYSKNWDLYDSCFLNIIATNLLAVLSFVHKCYFFMNWNSCKLCFEKQVFVSPGFKYYFKYEKMLKKNLNFSQRKELNLLAKRQYLFLYLRFLFSKTKYKMIRLLKK